MSLRRHILYWISALGESMREWADNKLFPPGCVLVFSERQPDDVTGEP